MKSLFLAAGVAMLALPQSAAQGASITLGGPLSRLCYESALASDSRPVSIEGCTRSLEEEALTTSDRAATYVNRGILHMMRGHETDAEADFNVALSVDQSLPDAWLNKGFLRLRQGRGSEALSLLNEGIKRRPQRQALAYLARGLAYEDVGDLDSAYADLRRAQDLEPRWSLPGRYLARYQVRANR
jgi:tetratricopeptide (TPR) repeat protein